jgi:hypothetical protein
VSADESPIGFAPKAGAAGVDPKEKPPLGAAPEPAAGVKAGVLPKLKAGAGAAADSVLGAGVAPKLNAGVVETESPVGALGAGKDDGTSTEEAKDGGAVVASVDVAPN